MSQSLSSQNVWQHEQDPATKAETLETFSSRLKQLHRLSTSKYDDAGDLLDDYLRTGCDMFDMDAGAINRVHGTRCVFRAGVGNVPGLAAGSTFDLSEMLCEQVVRERRTVLYEDVAAIPELVDHSAFVDLNVRAYIGSPIFLGDDEALYGVVLFASEQAHAAFTDQDREILELMVEGIERFLDRDAIEQERATAMKVLQSSQQLLSGILSSSRDGVMAFEAVRDDAGDVVDFEWLLANPRSAELTGRDADQLVGRHLLDEVPAVTEFGLLDAFVHVVETGEPLDWELRYADDQGEHWLHIAAVQLGDGVTATLRDVTERRTAEQALERTNDALEQRNRELQDFAYVASHDLQEPLRKIRAFGDLLEDDYGDRLDETGSYYLDRMRDAARRMSQLISDLLAFSRVTTRGRPFEEVDLNEVMIDVLSDLTVRISEVEGTVDVDELPAIEADPIQMHQLLLNLVGNALKFCRSGVPPVVHVSAERLETTGDEPAGEWIVLTVRDNGIGFDEKYLDRIFTPFQRLHGRGDYAGTGMGLAICRRIIERHMGTIDAGSQPGEGSTFAIKLPVRQPSQQEAPADRLDPIDEQ